MYYFLRVIAYLSFFLWALLLLDPIMNLINPSDDYIYDFIGYGLYLLFTLISWYIIKVCNRKIRLEKEAYKYYKNKNKVKRE